MKFQQLLCTILLTASLTTISQAQKTNTQTFSDGFNQILEDAKNGFPNTKGELIEKVEWLGNTYAAKKKILEQFDSARLYYRKAHEPTKYVPEATPEEFWYSQSFREGIEGHDFIKDSLESLLNAKAKELGLTKIETKQPKEYRKKYREYFYRLEGKNIFSLLQNLESNAFSIGLYSPFRPSDVPKPKNRLGCVAFSYKGFNFIYVVTVYGEKIENMNDIYKKAFAATGLTDNNYIRSWYPKKSITEVELQLGKSLTVRDSGSIDAN